MSISLILSLIFLQISTDITYFFCLILYINNYNNFKYSLYYNILRIMSKTYEIIGNLIFTLIFNA